ncbi:class I SAM-dependent methyltransferase [Francisella sp. SYW-9]|uniref:class I SAM-dependent methyltransferase n=1 Tax=Francisella sp. SYW-9 TaxID=2610888 RepID=UPI00168D58EE|nr:class I SAM-dependent methyltransferase [Francisella sp. SYW-9]
MKATDYYHNIKKKWELEYPSSNSLDQVWDFYLECGYTEPKKLLGSILDKVKWKKNRMLDYGCDNGLMLDFICNKYPVSGFGVDINEASINSAKKNLPQYNFRTIDGINIPYDDKYFDLVFISAVVKHIRYEDRVSFYNEIKRVADQVFIIEIDAKKKEIYPYESWKFYYSNFEEEFAQHFKPIVTHHEAGDILGLYEV